MCWSAGVVVLLAAVFVAAILAPPYLRRQAVERARGRGVALAVGSVRASWRRLILTDVDARLEGVDGVHARAREVAVGWGARGLGDVDVIALSIEAEGTADELRRAVEGWKQRHPAIAREGADRGRSFSLRDTRVRWTVAGEEAAAGSVTTIAIDPATVSVRGAAGAIRLGSSEAHVVKLATDYARSSGLFGSVVAEQVTVSIGAHGGELLGGATPVSAARPLAAGRAGAGLLDRQTSWAVLDQIRDGIARLSAHFQQGVELRAQELTIASENGALGPWGVRVILGTDATSFELDPATKEGRRPLVLRALVPRSRGRWTGEARFGPAPLAALGVQENAFGLVHVATATAEVKGAVELDPDEQTFAADGSIVVKAGALADPRVADGTVEAVDLALKGIVASRGDLSSWTLSGGAFEIGALRLEVDGGMEVSTESRSGIRMWATWAIPTVSCADALGSLPRGLIRDLEGVEMRGTFGAHGSLAFDARAMDRTQVDFFLDQKCRVTRAPPALSVERFRAPFDLRVYDPAGKPRVARFGPGTQGWVSYTSISPYVIDAVLTCEDGAFFVHNGFSAGALKNALIANMKAGKFVLGASTVTMQLAKNLFLERRKQISRKLQELVLTMWLEQAMTKTEILELYLNVIEFGPNLYGIGPASWHYFGRPASELDPLEATFLVSILPSPVKRHAMYVAGRPSEGYMEYLRSLLKEEHRRGKLEDEELALVISAPLVFHRPGDPPPPPRSISARIHAVDEEGYEPVAAPAE